MTRLLLCGDGSKRAFSTPITIEDALAIFPHRYRIVPGPLQTPCWDWVGAREVQGYGYMVISGKHIKAHRLSLIYHGIAIGPEVKACHHCDRPPCVNPDHLFTGTNGDNIRDAISKGRWVPPKGENVATHKLTNLEVVEIRRLHSLGVPYRELTKQFGICNSTFYYIVNRVWWKHLH